MEKGQINPFGVLIAVIICGIVIVVLSNVLPSLMDNGLSSSLSGRSGGNLGIFAWNLIIPLGALGVAVLGFNFFSGRG